MEGNFYKNPLKVIWKARKNLMPSYLVILWLVFFIASISAAFYLNLIDFSLFKIGEYFTVSSTGLTLTLALFVAGKNAFSPDDLKVLANHESDEIKKGQLLIDFLGPYVFTAVLFLMLGLVSLFGPFLKIPLDYGYITFFKVFYINILALGLLSLFNLVIIMLNDVFLAAYRK